MEEINNIGEQPVNDSSQVLEIKKDDNSKVVGENDDVGSPIGKFKNVDKLYEAYNNLQSEFTRKCQQIKELKNNDNLTNNSNSSNNADIDVKPLYSSESWQNNVSDFVAKNPIAKDYAKEISMYLLNNKEVAKLPNALDLSLAVVLSKKYKTDDQIINDKDFINSKVLNNEEINNLIINNYLNKVSKHKVPPVISNGSGAYFQTYNNAPKSLDEAKKQVEQLFL